MWLGARHFDQARHLRVHLLLPAACLLLALGGRLATPVSGPLPVRRVILVSVDTLRADRLGAYGYPRPTSPILDRFASEGTRFATCIAASPWTLPSHISMLTGLYPTHHGALHVRQPLRTGVRLVSEELAGHGFRTAAIVASDLVLPNEGSRRGFEHYQEFPWRDLAATSGPSILNTGAEVTAAATTWLEHLTADDSFFLFLHYYDVHSDYSPEPRFRTLLGADADLEPGSSTFLIAHRDDGALTAKERLQTQRLYDAEIRQLDAHLGTLFGALRELGLESRTLVVVTSDHGEEFREHGRLLHGRALYEESMHVPLIMRGPGVPRGHVVTQLTSHVDITPTILAATGTGLADQLDGSSLLRSLTAFDDERPDFVVGGATHRGDVRMVRTARFKLIDRRVGNDELYDLELDPGERTNIIAHQPSRHAGLARRFARSGGQLSNDPVGQLSTTDRERLRALGYLD